MPAVQLYTAVFPCQTFISAGARRGARYPYGQSVIQSVLGNIRGKRPTMFVLGSVRGLVHHHHDACKWILLQIEGTRAGQDHSQVGLARYPVPGEERVHLARRSPDQAW